MTDIPLERIAEAMVTPRFAALARAGLRLDAVTSWDPALPRDDRLLVPIDVRALAVPAGSGVSAVPTAVVVPVSQPGDPDEAVLPVPPEPFGDPVERAPGVHLHWAMPDGLTKGDAGTARETSAPAGNPTGLPPLPDRWIVVRLTHGTADTRSWILESDRGRSTDLAGWTDPGPAAPGDGVITQDRLTAVAGGDPAWAATYDAVINRFAFHDDLDGVPAAASLSYLVAGWWSDPALDPLHDCTSTGAYHERTAWLGWLAPEPAALAESAAERTAQRDRRATVGLHSPPIAKTGRTAADGTEITLAPETLLDETAEQVTARGPAMPRQTLLHGSLLGLALSTGPDLAPDPHAVQVALGPSSFSALGALLADGDGEQRVSTERALAAFASGLLETIDTPGGLAAVDEDRHAGGFTALSGGSRARPDRIAEGDIMAGDRPGPMPSVKTPPDAGGPTARAERSLRSRLVPRSSHSVLADSLSRRFPASRTAAPRTYRDVAVPAPRSFVPNDPALVLRGAARSPRHGGDGSFTHEGLLACRLPSQVVSGLYGLLGVGRLPTGLRSVGSGAVPAEVDALLREVVLTDPYRWREITEWATTTAQADEGPVGARVRAELALRHVRPTSRGLRPEVDDHVADVLRRASLQEGDDVSPVGVTRWAQPWVPLWCDWELELRVDDRLDRWQLGPIDLESAHPDPVAPSSSRVLRGRTLLASATAKALAGRIRRWLSEEDAREQSGHNQVGEEHEEALAAAAAAADGADLLTGSLSGIRETLLGLDPHDAARVRIAADGTPLGKPLARELPLLLAGGAATLVRLRVVDAFGRWLDIPAERLAAAEIATANRHPAGPPSLTVPPRLQRPGRLAFRFVDPQVPDGDPDVEARVDQQHPDQAVSPVAGWLLPDHVDEAMEFFDPSGAPLGQLRHDELTGAVVWESAPGLPGPAGGPPDPGADPGARHVTRLAAGLVEADARARRDPSGQGADSALSALLRAIDTTLWTVDPLGSVGTGAVAGLVGRPIAVVRATLRLDVLDDLDALVHGPEPSREARARAYAELAARAVAVRLGELTRTDDGLLGYVLDDDYSQIRLVASEVRTQARVSGRLRGQLAVFGAESRQPPAVVPIRHPYVAGPTDVALRPGHTARLTLLLHPGGKVHATCGVLPRKALALARDWFHPALLRLSPSFRVGPVLVDPTAVRLPAITGLGDGQQFTRRDTSLTWRDDPIVAATQTAYLPDLPSTAQEGWIRVQQLDPQEDTP
ncbi:hypothetical protein [Streptomyces sp. NPDC002088]|uniref:hypothetical protein n=1 Tax=Streptomyces sp. NPDC002088 TaxID=3154665 RepID=UPI0033182962